MAKTKEANECRAPSDPAAPFSMPVANPAIPAKSSARMHQNMFGSARIPKPSSYLLPDFLRTSSYRWIYCLIVCLVGQDGYSLPFTANSRTSCPDDDPHSPFRWKPWTGACTKPAMPEVAPCSMTFTGNRTLKVLQCQCAVTITTLGFHSPNSTGRTL